MKEKLESQGKPRGRQTAALRREQDRKGLQEAWRPGKQQHPYHLCKDPASLQFAILALVFPSGTRVGKCELGFMASP